MAAASPSSPIVSFGLYELDPARWELRREGMLIKLQQQPCQLLYLLSSYPQEVIGREEIRRNIWPDEVSGEFGARINYCIAQIRDALGDSAENPRFIKTVRGKGYCFVAPRLDASAVVAPVHRQKWALPLVLVGVAMLLTSVVLFRRGRQPSTLPSIGVGAAITLLVTRGEILGLIYAHGYLYYTAAGLAGRETLFRVAEGGGSPQPLLSGLNEPEALAVSPDGSTLAIGQTQYTGVPSPDWLLPASGGKLKPFGEVCGGAVAWSPDGHSVAFLKQNMLMLADGQGKHAHALAKFPRVDAEALAWSPHGRTLAVATQNLVAASVDIWLETTAGGPPRHLVTLQDQSSPWGLTWLRGGHRLLLGTGNRSTSMKSVTAVTLPPQGGRSAAPQVLWTGSNNGESSGPALDGQGRLLIGDAEASATSLLRWQPAHHRFTRSLPGVRELDYSPDHTQIAYVRAADGSLWIARADGSQARAIAGPPEQTMLPRWSPDGTRLAFSALPQKGNWRLYVDATRGQAKPEPLPSPNPWNGQGAPTWLPNNRSLIYANVACTQATTCGVHRLDLTSQRDTMLPGSAGMRTARVSPDGRWIAALQGFGSAVMLYDLDHPGRGWQTFWPHPVGDFLAWAADSRSLFFVTLGAQAVAVERIAVNGGSPHVVASEADPAPGFVQPFDWFGLAPGNLPLLSQARLELQIEAIPLRPH